MPFGHLDHRHLAEMIDDAPFGDSVNSVPCISGLSSPIRTIPSLVGIYHTTYCMYPV